jgi:type IV pilus assembly protein PilB
MRHEKLGETLRQEGFISQDELEKGLDKQTELKRKRIGDILLEEGKVKVAEIKEALSLQKTNFDSKLGEILIAAGTVTEDQVNEALALQEKNSTKRLGQILVEMGLVKEEMLALAVALKYGLPYVDLKDYPVDPAALKCVSVSLARKLSVIPLHLTGKELTIAFSDPTNLEPKRDLAFHTGKMIKEVVSAENGISSAIDRYYGSDADSYLERLLGDESDIEQLSGSSDDQFELGDDTGLEKPIIELVNHIIKSAVVKKASDLHIIPEGRRVKVVLRIDGELHDELTLGGERLPSVVARLKIMGNMNIAERRLPQDGRAKVKVGNRIVDLRFSCMPSIFGESMAIRLLDKERGVMGLDELGFLEKELKEIRASQKKSYGMILVTGPTGSGKSSTIYALLQEPVFSNKNIITLEDPVEYELPGLTQIQIKEKIGLTFARGLRQILRHDPDVITVGEIRDVETAKIAIQSALTGHILFSTLHTNTAAESFVRLGEMGVEPYLISSSILGIISQRLIKKLCPECRAIDPKGREKLAESHFPVQPPEGSQFYQAVGCDKCNKTGFLGRTVVYEYLEPNEAIKRAAIHNESASVLRNLAVNRGMRTIEHICLVKASQGLTTVDEIIPLATIDHDPE